MLQLQMEEEQGSQIYIYFHFQDHQVNLQFLTSSSKIIRFSTSCKNFNNEYLSY